MILQGDALTVLRTLPAESVQCVVTSPPYWGLRDYQTPGQLGLERTPEEYVGKLVEVFAEVRRVLRKDGTVFLNLGDTYASAWPCQRRNVVGTGSLENGKREARPPRMPDGLKEKDLVGIPWRVAFALQADGWYLRSDVIEEVQLYCPCGCGYQLEERIWRWSQDRDLIWKKPNPMPESVTDRPTKSHEYIFLLTKSPRYYFDQEAVREAHEHPEVAHTSQRVSNAQESAYFGNAPTNLGRAGNHPNGRNIRSVWNIATQPYPESHFATFPEALAERCIKAGTSEKGCCATCGTPWERVTEKGDPHPVRGEYLGPIEQDAKLDGRAGFHGAGSGSMVRTTEGWSFLKRDNLTTGWRPGCFHPDGLCLCTPGHSYGCAMPEAPIACTVLDPFCGSGTTGVVALALQRNFIGIELNPKYCEMAERRIYDSAPLLTALSEA